MLGRHVLECGPAAVDPVVRIVQLDRVGYTLPLRASTVAGD
ncbi:hypothetical protein [Nocardia canadensis]|nr:hypothetical protein [Nocardia canadensis]